MVKPTFDYLEGELFMHEHEIEDINGLSGAMIWQGAINTKTDFPLLSDVANGWTYSVLADVTDDQDDIIPIQFDSGSTSNTVNVTGISIGGNHYLTAFFREVAGASYAGEELLRMTTNNGHSLRLFMNSETQATVSIYQSSTKRQSRTITLDGTFKSIGFRVSGGSFVYCDINGVYQMAYGSMYSSSITRIEMGKGANGVVDRIMGTNKAISDTQKLDFHNEGRAPYASTAIPEEDREFYLFNNGDGDANWHLETGSPTVVVTGTHSLDYEAVEREPLTNPHTNTRQTFLAGNEIAWNGTDWTDLGSETLLYRDGTTLKTINVGDDLEIGGVITAQSGLDVNSQLITSVATPVSDTDAANKVYVDDEITALGINNPLDNQGKINAPGDFPLRSVIDNGWLYEITSDVTDNEDEVTPMAFASGETVTLTGSTFWNALDSSMMLTCRVDNLSAPDGTIIFDIRNNSTYYMTATILGGKVRVDCKHSSYTGGYTATVTEGVPFTIGFSKWNAGSNFADIYFNGVFVSSWRASFINPITQIVLGGTDFEGYVDRIYGSSSNALVTADMLALHNESITNYQTTLAPPNSLIFNNGTTNGDWYDSYGSATGVVSGTPTGDTTTIFRIGTETTSNTGLSFNAKDDIYWDGSTWVVLGNNDIAVETITATTKTLSLTNNLVLVDDDTAGAEVTVTLPAASGNSGLQYHIKKLGTTADVVVSGDGNIDGDANATIRDQYVTITIVCDGTNWHII